MLNPQAIDNLQLRFVWEPYYYFYTDRHPVAILDALGWIEVSEDGGRRVSRYYELRGSLTGSKEVKMTRPNGAVEFVYLDVSERLGTEGKARVMRREDWVELDGCFGGSLGK
jgi:hypothetical protein